MKIVVSICICICLFLVGCSQEKAGSSSHNCDSSYNCDYSYDCYSSYNCDYSYDCYSSYSCDYSYRCDSSYNCDYSYDCYSSYNCDYSYKKVNAINCIFNVQVTKDRQNELRRKIYAILSVWRPKIVKKISDKKWRYYTPQEVWKDFPGKKELLDLIKTEFSEDDRKIALEALYNLTGISETTGDEVMIDGKVFSKKTIKNALKECVKE